MYECVLFVVLWIVFGEHHSFSMAAICAKEGKVIAYISFKTFMIEKMSRGTRKGDLT